MARKPFWLYLQKLDSSNSAMCKAGEAGPERLLHVRVNGRQSALFMKAFGGASTTMASLCQGKFCAYLGLLQQHEGVLCQEHFEMAMS